MDMTLLYDKGEIDLSQWEFDSGLRALDYAIGGAATTALRESFTEHPPSISLSNQRLIVTVPITLRVWLPGLGETEDEGPHYEASLREIVNEEMEDAGHEETGNALIAFAADLRAIADYVEAGVAKAQKERMEADREVEPREGGVDVDHQKT